MKRQQPGTFKPDFELIKDKPMWYQCMMCNTSEYTPEYELDSPSSSVCRSKLCRIEFALLYSTNEEQFKENLEELIIT